MSKDGRYRRVMTFAHLFVITRLCYVLIVCTVNTFSTMPENLPDSDIDVCFGSRQLMSELDYLSRAIGYCWFEATPGTFPVAKPP
jgi:hypothetical protein